MSMNKGLKTTHRFSILYISENEIGEEELIGKLFDALQTGNEEIVISPEPEPQFPTETFPH